MLDNRYITWNGKTSIEMGLWVKKVPALNRPARRHSKYSISQKNGDEFILDGIWENYIQEYKFFIKNNDGNVDIPAKAAEIAEWLHNEKSTGYQELRDSLEPDYFRLAVLVNPIDIANNLEQFGEITVKFNCRPERFLESGNEWVEDVQYSQRIKNPTKFKAYPIIKLYGNKVNRRSLFYWKERTNNGLQYSIADENSYIFLNDSTELPVTQPQYPNARITLTDNSITIVNNSATPCVIGFPISLQNKKMYKIKYNQTGANGEIYIRYYDDAGKYISRTSFTKDIENPIPVDGEYSLIIIKAVQGTQTFSNIQLWERDSTNSEFVGGDYKQVVVEIASTADNVPLRHAITRYVDDVLYIDCDDLRTYYEDGKDAPPLVEYTNRILPESSDEILTSKELYIDGNEYVRVRVSALGQQSPVTRVDILPRWWTL